MTGSSTGASTAPLAAAIGVPTRRAGSCAPVVLADRRWRTVLSLALRGEGSRTTVRRFRAMFRAEVDRLERLASRFRADSALSAVNAAPGRWVDVPRGLVELVEVGLAAAEATDGLVSPCVGHHVDAIGYRAWAESAEWAESPVGTRLVTVDARGNHRGLIDADAWQRVEVARERVRIPVGVQLDLGATAKAWLADELAERVAADSDLDVVANMGGDLRVIARRGPWTVGIDHELPGGPADPTPSLMLAGGGLATSGQGRRRWSTALGTVHHVVDPRTGGAAATRWWAVSVLASCATAANTAATAGLVLDSRAPDWLQRHGLDAVLTQWRPGAAPVVATVGRWPGMQAVA